MQIDGNCGEVEVEWEETQDVIKVPVGKEYGAERKTPLVKLIAKKVPFFSRINQNGRVVL